MPGLKAWSYFLKIEHLYSPFDVNGCNTVEPLYNEHA